MNDFHPSLKASRVLPALALSLALLGGTTIVTSGCSRGPATVLAELNQAGRLLADLSVHFSKAADASNRAVMADTDEASIAFAHEAEQSSAAVERDVRAIDPILRRLDVTEEVQLLEQFGKNFADYHALDRTILALAIENTNLKAQRLSFGAAREAADRVKSELARLVLALPTNDRCRAAALVADAVLSVRELQTILGPHIASADDAAMNTMEKDMATLETRVDNALLGLHGLLDPHGLLAAHADFEQFKSVERQIVVLSRRNSNVRSLDLSLRAKPPLTAACEDSLRNLRAALANEGSKATR